MAKCGGCGQFISPIDAAKCDICRAMYHRACVGISHKLNISSPWHCPECRKNVARDNRTETPVGSRRQKTQPNTSDDTLDTSQSSDVQELTRVFKAELQSFQEEFMRTMRGELKLVREEITALKHVVSSCQDRMSALEERVAVLESQKQTQPVISTDVDSIIAQLKCDLNDRDQDLLANDIEIANLPEVVGENPIHTAMLVATKIGVTLEFRDIVSAERVGGRRINATEQASATPENQHSIRPRHLVVRLARRDLRDQLLLNARVRRGTTTADLGLTGPTKRFYINERLTKVNRQLFRKARDAAREHGWQYVWSKKGRILARSKPGDPAFSIRCEKDLQHISGLVK